MTAISSFLFKRHEEITLAQDAERKPKNELKCDWTTACAFPAPAGFFLSPSLSSEVVTENDEEKEFSYSAALGIYFRINWPAFLLVCIISALLAFFCHRRQRRYALPWTRVWTALVFLFGVPAFLGYRFHRRWTVLDDCPQCKKKVPRDREACAACGQSFPPPEQKGIEVFA